MQGTNIGDSKFASVPVSAPSTTEVYVFCRVDRCGAVRDDSYVHAPRGARNKVVDCTDDKEKESSDPCLGSVTENGDEWKAIQSTDTINDSLRQETCGSSDDQERGRERLVWPDT